MALFLCKFTAACLNALQLKKLDFKWQLFFFTFRVNCYKPTFILFAFKLRDDTSLIILIKDMIWKKEIMLTFFAYQCLIVSYNLTDSNPSDQNYQTKMILALFLKFWLPGHCAKSESAALLFSNKQRPAWTVLKVSLISIIK